MLFVGPFNGGIGGIERLTKHFATWVESSGYSALMVLENDDFPVGPYTVTPTDRVAVATGKAWTSALATEAFDFVYIMPAGLGAKTWVRRLESLRNAAYRARSRSQASIRVRDRPLSL